MPRKTTSNARSSGKESRPEDTHRLFLAVPLPPGVQSLIARLLESGTLASLPFRWVRPEIAHVTLHFLGDTPIEREALLIESLRRFDAGPPIRLQSAQVGVFPHPRKPRVLWLGMTGQTSRLVGLHERLGSALDELDFEVEKRAFHPHITLGRARKETSKTLPRDVENALQSRQVQDLCRDHLQRFSVDSVHLIRSHLESGGPRYETILQLPTGGRTNG